MLAGFAMLGISITLLAIGIPAPAGMVGVGIAFASVVLGVLLVWSAILPFMKHQRRVLAKYGLNSAERATVVSRLIWRDVFSKRR